MLGKHIGKGQGSEPFRLKLMQKKIFDMFTLKENSSDLQINFLAKSSWTWTKSLDWSTSISIQVVSIMCFLRKTKKTPRPTSPVDHAWTTLVPRFDPNGPTCPKSLHASRSVSASEEPEAPSWDWTAGNLKTERLTLKNHKLNIHKQIFMKVTQISIKDYEFKQMSIKDDEYL